MIKRILLFTTCFAALFSNPLYGQGIESNQARKKAQDLQRQGNFKEAFVAFEKLCTSPDTDHKLISSDLVNAIKCLNRLGNQKRFDELIEKSIQAQPKNWRLLQTAAGQYMNVAHYGYMISGNYERGQHRGGGKMVNSQERDRVRALQLMTTALPQVLDEDDKTIANFFVDLSNQLFFYRGYQESWRLQYKTDLAVLPDYAEGFPYNRGGQGATVDDQGNPVYYKIASDWENALNDGERWRFCLNQAVAKDPARRNLIAQQLAQFSRNQFGVTTLRSGLFWPAMVRHSEDTSNTKDESGVYAIHTLSSKETI
ncbi:MAG: hypothetical protein VX438_00425, partial [Planctomycetota bacterium]|nr:hypothetical protein [Planctomycetota bacterium]